MCLDGGQGVVDETCNLPFGTMIRIPSERIKQTEADLSSAFSMKSPRTIRPRDDQYGQYTTPSGGREARTRIRPWDDQMEQSHEEDKGTVWFQIWRDRETNA
ncbi:hypothetical protein E4U54_005273 [Claviceps lovelessii]|nr:hypothetical protein E4U54_005273 [Claviceps lovelessii]